MTAPRQLRWLVLCAALLAARSASAQTYSVLHDFSAGAGHPQAPLIQATDGSIWGTSYDGGAYGAGSIFTLTPDGLGGFTYAERYSFTNGADGSLPTAGLVQASDGRMYGVTSSGNLGTIFRINSDGNGFLTVHTFTTPDGQSPASALIQGSGGLLYGVAQYGGASNFGTVFAFNPVNSLFTVLHDFDNTQGATPVGSLLEAADGRLYGTTLAGGSSGFSGTVFGMDESGDNFGVLLDFSSTSGHNPRSALIQLGDGFLYGTTINGDDVRGTVFKIDTDGNNFQIIHVIQQGEGKYLFAGLVQGEDGLLYGTSKNTDSADDGTVYRLDSAGGNFEVVHTFLPTEGQQPWAALLRTADGSLLGTNDAAGDGGNGSVFRLDPATSAVTVLHAFPAPDAFNPLSSLVAGPGGFLYGTTAQGGPYGSGAVFKIDPTGTSYTILHGFGSADGAGATAALIVGSDGKLYGTTTFGGGFGAGNVFRVDPDGMNFEVIHDFQLLDGNQAYGGVIQASDGKLYGGALAGGQFGGGVVYRLDTDGGNFEVIHSFSFVSTPLGGPQGALLQAADGKLYGTTLQGGALDYGTIFRVDLDGGDFETIHEFAGPDGRFPTAGLIQAANGKLYGTGAQGGGAGDWGTVFELAPSGMGFKVLHRFNLVDGGYVYGPLLEAADGLLYGTTVDGTIYRINPAQAPAFSNSWGANFARLHVFDYITGAGPYGGLVQGADGSLYGTTNQGGAFLGGVVYKLELATAAKARKPRFSSRR